MTVKTTEEYNGFKLAREMLELNMSDAVGKRRKYTKGYLVFALTMRTALGCSKYEALRRLNFIPLPCRKEVDQYLRDTPTTSRPRELDEQTKELLEEVSCCCCCCFCCCCFCCCFFCCCRCCCWDGEIWWNGETVRWWVGEIVRWWDGEMVRWLCCWLVGCCCCYCCCSGNCCCYCCCCCCCCCCLLLVLL